ncbi:MAG: hypothetical protein KAH03_02480 [Cocleimonas sp.]|nr:hypothetical protein [Cocleimonas sp.]
MSKGVGNTTLGFTDEDRRLLIDVKAQTDKIPAIQAQIDKLTAIKAQTDKIPAIQAQTNTLPAIKAKTDTITAGGLTPAQATQINGIKSQTDKLSEIQSDVVRINRGVGIRAGDRSVYFVVNAVDTLVRHADTAVVSIKAQTDTLPAIKTKTDKITAIQTETEKITAIKVQTDKLSTVDTKVNEIHQRKALDGAKPVTFKGDGAITSSGMNITAQELGDGSIKQTRQP